MEAVLLITLLMVVVDGPVTPSEIRRDLHAGSMTEEPALKSSAWQGGPDVNMWTGGEPQDEVE